MLLRFAIWEQHGGAKAQSCRNIDNGLQGKQNGVVGTQFTIRPADIDAIISLIRAVVEAFPGCFLRGSTSDFKSAYRQATANPLQAMFWILAIFDPIRKVPCFAIAAAQLFGCSCAPLNFCRIPDWCTFVSSRLLFAAFISCIDDIIFVEPDHFVDSAYKLWRLFANLCGWAIPDAKSPPPTASFRALGAIVRLSSQTCAKSSIQVSKDRVDKMIKILIEIENDGGLASGLSGQIFGQLGFACIQVHGKWGRAKMRPFVRRQYESNKFSLNPQLRSSISWWKRNLPIAPIRQVFVNDHSRHVVISYSDGEGSDAGVGIAIWCPSKITRPWAGFITVLEEVSELWQLQHRHAVTQVEGNPELEFNDIIEIEGVGPLLILANWGHILRHSLWLHFIDNSCALGSFVKGSSTVTQQDVIVGKT